MLAGFDIARLQPGGTGPDTAGEAGFLPATLTLHRPGAWHLALAPRTGQAFRAASLVAPAPIYGDPDWMGRAGLGQPQVEALVPPGLDDRSWQAEARARRGLAAYIPAAAVIQAVDCPGAAWICPPQPVRSPAAAVRPAFFARPAVGCPGAPQSRTPKPVPRSAEPADRPAAPRGGDRWRAAPSRPLARDMRLSFAGAGFQRPPVRSPLPRPAAVTDASLLGRLDPPLPHVPAISRQLPRLGGRPASPGRSLAPAGAKPLRPHPLPLAAGGSPAPRLQPAPACVFPDLVCAAPPSLRAALPQRPREITLVVPAAESWAGFATQPTAHAALPLAVWEPGTAGPAVLRVYPEILYGRTARSANWGLSLYLAGPRLAGLAAAVPAPAGHRAAAPDPHRPRRAVPGLAPEIVRAAPAVRRPLASLSGKAAPALAGPLRVDVGCARPLADALWPHRLAPAAWHVLATPANLPHRPIRVASLTPGPPAGVVPLELPWRRTPRWALRAVGWRAPRAKFFLESASLHPSPSRLEDAIEQDWRHFSRFDRVRLSMRGLLRRMERETHG